MPDIVERLRDTADTADSEEDILILNLRQAADEIEGLRKWNAWFAANNTDWKTKNKEAADEIERLRTQVNDLKVELDLALIAYEDLRRGDS